MAQDFGGALEDEADLMVVVVAVAMGAGLAGGGDTGSGGLVVEVAADFLQALVEGGEEDGFFVFAEALEVAVGALGEEETTAGGDLEALVDELVLIGAGEEAEVDFGAPDGFAVLLLEELALAVEAGEGLGREGSLPGALVAGYGYLEFAGLGELIEGFGAVVVGCADEGDFAVAVLVGPA